MGPDGPEKPAKYWETPTDVPRIDLTANNKPLSWTIEPTIINTHKFKKQRQLGDPSEPPFYRPAKFLPAHKKPTRNERGTPNELRAGFGNTNTLIHNESGFEGIVQTPWTPPDPSIAVGPNHVLMTVNMAIAWYDKDGNEQFSARLDSTGDPGFFEDIGCGDFTFDPKCFYDPHEERYVVLALEHYDFESWITIAVSDDDDPNGIWYKYRTWSVVNVGNSEFWIDYPGFGFDETHYYVTGNLFGLNLTGWAGVLYRIFEKEPMLNGNPVVISDIREGGHASMQGAQQYGESNAAFFVGRNNSTSLKVAIIEDPFSPHVISTNIAVPANSAPGGVPNPGGTISALDGRMMNAQVRDGSLWTTHGIAFDNEITSISRWYEIDVSDFPSTPTLVQSGNVAMPNSLSSFFPAIAPNKRGEVAMVMAAANGSTLPGLYLVGRKQSDSQGEMGVPLNVANGTTGADGRWGDYFDMTIDPNNETRFWYVGEYQTDAGWQTYFGSAVLTCVEDINADGNVSVSDLLLLIANWGQNNDGAEIAAPYNAIDVSDILALIAKFGSCPQ